LQYYDKDIQLSKLIFRIILFVHFVGWWVGFGCGWAKLNVLQFGSACGLHCSSFNFAKGWHFVVRCQHESLMLERSSSLAGNGLRLGEGGDFTTELSYEAHTSNLRKTVIRSTEPPLLPNRCYQLPFCLSEVFSLLNIH
jgi:hypothetical protein